MSSYHLNFAQKLAFCGGFFISCSENGSCWIPLLCQALRASREASIRLESNRLDARQTSQQCFKPCRCQLAPVLDGQQSSAHGSYRAAGPVSSPVISHRMDLSVGRDTRQQFDIGGTIITSPTASDSYLSSRMRSIVHHNHGYPTRVLDQGLPSTRGSPPASSL